MGNFFFSEKCLPANISQKSINTKKYWYSSVPNNFFMKDIEHTPHFW